MLNRRPFISRLLTFALAAFAVLAGPRFAEAQCQQAKLTASDAGPGDHFGASVSLGGDWLVVGADFDDDACPGDPLCFSGSAYVFRFLGAETPLDPTDDVWIEHTKLVPSDTTDGQQFGEAISLSPDHVVVGAWGDKHAGVLSGAAYVFRRDDAGTPNDSSDDLWVEESKLTANDAAVNDWFGIAVGVSSKWIVVGAPYHDEACPCCPGSLCDSGSAYVFRLDNAGTPDDPNDDAWIQHAELVPSDTEVLDEFGMSVAIDGDRIVIAAPNEGNSGDPVAQDGLGAAYVFRRDDRGTPSDLSDDQWIEQSKLIGSDTFERDEFGSAVALDGVYIVVGAFADDDACTADPFCDSGSAYVFGLLEPPTPNERGSDVWIEEAKLTAPDEATDFRFGLSVTIQATQIVIGAPGENHAGFNTGSAYVFQRQGGQAAPVGTSAIWTVVRKLVASDASATDGFAIAVSIDDDRIVVGAGNKVEDDIRSGSAYLFSPMACFGEAIPAVQGWGALVFTLLVLTGASVIIVRKERSHPRADGR